MAKVKRQPHEYPAAIQLAGQPAMRVYDRVERGLLSDGYTPDEAMMLMDINQDQILAQAQTEAKTETARGSKDARRTRQSNSPRRKR